MNKQNKKTNKHYDFLVVRKKHESFFIHVKDILFLESLNGLVKIHTSDNEYCTNKTLSELVSFFDLTFIRTHRSYIVNTDKIYKIENIGNKSFRIEFKNIKKYALMSRYRYKEIKEKIIPFTV